MNPEIMKQAGFTKEVEMVQAGKCPFCGSHNQSFRDAISLEEFRISGLCQKCQDEVFGND